MVVRLRVLLAAAGLMAIAGCDQPVEAPVEAPVDTASTAPVDVTPDEASGASGADAITPNNPFFGAWSMTSAKVAPWWDGKGEEPAADPAFANKIVLGANKTSGPDILDCDKPKYMVNIVSPRSLFEGNLPDPGKNATELGFKSSDITTMNFTCSENARDVSLDFPMIDDDTIMLGLDNVLYTFKRTRA